MKNLREFLYRKKTIMFVEALILLVYGIFAWISYDKMEQLSYVADDMQLLCTDGGLTDGCYMDASIEEAAAVVSPVLPLSRGIYEIRISLAGQGVIRGGLLYENPRNGNTLVDEDEFYVHPEKSVFSYRVKRSDDSPVRFKLRLTADAVEGDYVMFTGIQVTPSFSSFVYRMFCLAASFLLLDLLIWGYFRYYRNWQAEERAVFVVLACWVVVSGLPLMQKGLTMCSDLVFHLQRIEGLYQGLMAGKFPVRIQPGWMEGHGYAVFMYGDLLLYFPAFLRLVGFTVEEAYKLYLFFINAGTAAIAFYAFYRMTKDRLAALVGSVLYVGSVCRFFTLYEAWVGRSAAMMFFPLVLAGFYLLLTLDVESEEYDRIWPCLTFGFTGLLLTHMLSTLMAGVYAVLVCLVFIRKILRKKTLLVLIKSAGIALGLSFWYLVPMLSFLLREKLMVNAGFAKAEVTDYYAELADFLQDGKNLYQLFVEDKSFGYVLLFILILYVVWLAWQKEKTLPESGRWLFGMTIFSLWVCTIYFPMVPLSKISSVMPRFLKLMQFQDRFLSAAVLFAVGFAVVFSASVFSGMKHGGQWIVVLVLSVLVFGQAAAYFKTEAVTQWRALDTADLNFELGESLTSYSVGNGEYLPVTMDRSNLQTEIQIEEGLQMEVESRECLRYRVHVKGGEQAGNLTFPLTYYSGYQAKDLRNGAKLNTCLGNNGCVTVEVPAGYDGSFELEFHEAWYWRVAEIISLLTLIITILYRKGVKKDGNQETDSPVISQVWQGCGGDRFHGTGGSDQE